MEISRDVYSFSESELLQKEYYKLVGGRMAAASRMGGCVLVGYTAVYSKEPSLGNQPLETQRWIWPEFLGNRLAGSETLSFQGSAPQAKNFLPIISHYFRYFP